MPRFIRQLLQNHSGAASIAVAKTWRFATHTPTFSIAWTAKRTPRSNLALVRNAANRSESESRDWTISLIARSAKPHASFTATEKRDVIVSKSGFPNQISEMGRCEIAFHNRRFEAPKQITLIKSKPGRP
ncbi:MAG: hypothetical protein NTX56_18945, partial [Proteobacteria bacterium]|nr:hypothetical protein [Pseudomonadota bacterium]